ncbi:MSMEG_0567/Sll0786 family nitrogen starvation N-acetyltransferase [Paenibacillus sp. TAF58]
MKNYEIRIAETEIETQASLLLRRQVFVEEQQLFEESDADENDSSSITINIWKQGTILVGTVRCYPDRKTPSLWWGGRLAVHEQYRIRGIGVYLIEAAVEQMKQRQVLCFRAQVQEQNVQLFEKLGWTKVGAPTFAQGLPHQIMEANLHVHDARKHKQSSRI